MLVIFLLKRAPEPAEHSHDPKVEFPMRPTRTRVVDDFLHAPVPNGPSPVIAAPEIPVHDSRYHVAPSAGGEMPVPQQPRHHLRRGTLDELRERGITAVALFRFLQDMPKAILGVEIRPGALVGVILLRVPTARGDGEAEHGLRVALRDGCRRAVQLGQFLGEGLPGTWAW